MKILEKLIELRNELERSAREHRAYAKVWDKKGTHEGIRFSWQLEGAAGAEENCALKLHMLIAKMEMAGEDYDFEDVRGP